MKRFCRPLMLVAALAVIVPGTAAAQDVRVLARDVPLSAARASTPRPAPLVFNMIGVHWQGSGQVWFRTADRPGHFGPWRPAQPEEEDTPDRGSDELAESAGWHVGNPWWTGDASLVEYRVTGSVTRLRTYFVDSPVTAADRARAVTTTAAATVSADEAAPLAQPPITRRAGWNADESIVRGPPSIADRLRFAVVHHTAGSNSYSAAESAAIVRGIQRYHVLSNGWDDIGYNFLVDKYGRIFEGRGGGIAQNVIGAHAGGFNTGSVGVAVIGIYDSATISTAARAALQNLLAWRLDVGHVYPRGHYIATSAGSSKWNAGAHVNLRAVSGHRDTSLTSCPGNTIYGLLNSIASRVTSIGLPKLWSPEAEGAVGGPVRFTARLSAARPWTVEVKDAAGTVVAQGNGNGTAVDWTWDASAVPIAFYTYTISAGAGVRPSTLPVPGPPPLAVTGLKATPRVITPNGDGNGELSKVAFGLTRRAVLGVRVVNASNGAAVRTLLASSLRPAGPRSLSWDGRTSGGAVVADGSYRIEVSAEDGPESVTRSVGVVVDRTLGGLTVAPTVLSPNGDGHAEPLAIGYALTRQATVKVQIRRGKTVVATVLSQSQAAGSHTASWNGRLANGKRVPDGELSAHVLATTSLGTRALARPIRLDTRAPALRILSVKVAGGIVRVRFTLDEAATVRIFYGRRVWSDGDDIVRPRRAGLHVISRRVNANVVRIVATDEAFNRSSAIRRR